MDSKKLGGNSFRVVLKNDKWEVKNMFTENEMKDKTILVGFTVYDKKKRFIEKRQLWGRITAVNKTTILIEQSNGEEFSIPNDPTAIERAKKGVYRLRSSGEEITDPDFLSAWVHILPYNIISEKKKEEKERAEKRRKNIFIIIIVMASIVFCVFSCRKGNNKKKEIFELVRNNEILLSEAVRTGKYNEVYEINGISEITVNEGYTVFYCSGGGIAPSSQEYGFYYSAENKPMAIFDGEAVCRPEDMKEKNGTYEYLDDSYNIYHAENITGNFYYYDNEL